MFKLEDSLGGETVLVATTEEDDTSGSIVAGDDGAGGTVMVATEDIHHEYIVEGHPGIKYTTCKFIKRFFWI